MRCELGRLLTSVNNKTVFSFGPLINCIKHLSCNTSFHKHWSLHSAIHLSRSVMFAFAVLVAASRLAAAKAYGEAFTLRDTLLPGHDLKTIKGADWLNCHRTCTSETRCLSFNYFKATNEKDNICKMNDRAMDNSCDTKGHLIISPGWLYNEVKRNVKVNSVSVRQYFSTKVDFNCWGSCSPNYTFWSRARTVRQNSLILQHSPNQVKLFTLHHVAANTCR